MIRFRVKKISYKKGTIFIYVERLIRKALVSEKTKDEKEMKDGF